MQCFLVEPVYDVPGSLEDYGGWPPCDRAILRWRNPATGEEKEWPHQFGVGAMWFATWYPKGFTWENETEPHLVVVTPGGEWDIDTRCSNCTLPTDRAHRCWVRHGTPPNITIDKGGHSCAAGAGSILTPRWHGFLRNGAFVNA